MLVIVTIGMFLAINSIAQVQFGNDIKVAAPRVPEQDVAPGNVQISSDTLVLVGVLARRMPGALPAARTTKVGLAFRAVASNPESSRLVGVPVGRMLMLGWAMAAAIGALAGALVDRDASGCRARAMQEILVFSFAAAALGGFDSPLGAVVGGLIVGVADTLTMQYSTSCTTSSSSCRSGSSCSCCSCGRRACSAARGGARVTSTDAHVFRLVAAVVLVVAVVCVRLLDPAGLRAVARHTSGPTRSTSESPRWVSTS